MKRESQPEPLDAVMAFHNAFRRDMKEIDAAALDWAGGKTEFGPKIDRFRFFNEVLVWHAHGEELAIFPLLESVAPSVAEAYERDHRGLDAAFNAMNTAVSVRNPLETARASASFKFHLDIHLGKEDAHLYRLIRERVPMPEQGKAVSIMSGAVPKDKYPEVIAWLYPLLLHDDRENMTRIWQMVMPLQEFSFAKQLIEKAIGNDWAELLRRIPDLA
jgi:hypothetical protein